MSCAFYITNYRTNYISQPLWQNQHVSDNDVLTSRVKGHRRITTHNSCALERLGNYYHHGQPGSIWRHLHVTSCIVYNPPHPSVLYSPEPRNWLIVYAYNSTWTDYTAIDHSYVYEFSHRQLLKRPNLSL